MKKGLLIIMAALMLTLVGCGSSNNQKEVFNANDNSSVVIKVGNFSVLQDEVRYYACRTQATYEAYYASKKKKLNWNSKVSGVTLAKAVKSTLLDEICRREFFYSLKDTMNVNLSEKQLLKIDQMVNDFYLEGNEDLTKRVSITKERLEAIFQKELIAKKVKKKLKKKKEKPEEKYNQWINDNNVITNELWDNINFDQPILGEK